MTEPLFQGKPWEFRGRRMERNAPRGTRCSPGCTHVKPSGAEALCTVCHEVFARPGNFDKHRSDGWCLDPRSLGLVANEEGVWRGTMAPEKILALRGYGEGGNGEDTEVQA